MSHPVRPYIRSRRGETVRIVVDILVWRVQTVRIESDRIEARFRFEEKYFEKSKNIRLSDASSHIRDLQSPAPMLPITATHILMYGPLGVKESQQAKTDPASCHFGPSNSLLFESKFWRPKLHFDHHKMCR